MPKRTRCAPFTLLSLLVTAALAAGIAGCKQERSIDLPDKNAVGGTELLRMQVVPTNMVVPDEVRRTWKAVVLEVTDKETRKAETFTIRIGETLPLGKSGLTAWVEGFLPDFLMAPDGFTSKSNELNHPAARVKITGKDGKQLFYSFLFALYPTTHPFEDPRYSVTLKDYLKN